MKFPTEQDDMDCQEALRCLFSLTELDGIVLETLRDGDEFRSNEMAEIIGKDQSTAYRSLEKLVKCGFAYKERHNIRNGGYYFCYSARPLEMVKEDALEYLEGCYNRFKKAIRDL